MSGGNCPETPRQKMIGMMYLFLTAMLALNVSGELLNAFKLVDESIQESIKTTDSKNADLMGRFTAAEAVNPGKVRPAREKADQIRNAANGLFEHIDSLKWMMKNTVDPNPETDLTNYLGSDNQDVAAQIMITEKGGERSKELKGMINSYKELLISFVDAKDTMLVNTITNSLSTDPIEPSSASQTKKVPWESQKFEHLPLSASFALLSSIQSNVRNMQADVMAGLLTGIDENTYKFNKIRSVVKPSSSMVLKGDKYSVELFIAATDEFQKPRFDIPGYSVNSNDEGIGILEIPANRVGKQKWEGRIWYKDPNGKEIPYDIEHEFEVMQPNAVISPTKMNVFYEALQNPVEVSVPGVSSSQLDVRFSNANARKRGNEYIVTPKPGTAGKKSIITVYADINGTNQRIGSKEFRIKPLPLPYASIAGKNDGKVKKNLLLAQSGIFAEMGEDFDFELEYKVTQFSIARNRQGFFVSLPSNSNKITEEQKELIKGASKGDRITIEDIKAVGPDKRNKKLASIVITVD